MSLYLIKVTIKNIQDMLTISKYIELALEEKEKIKINSSQLVSISSFKSSQSEIQKLQFDACEKCKKLGFCWEWKQWKLPKQRSH